MNKFFFSTHFLNKRVSFASYPFSSWQSRFISKRSTNYIIHFSNKISNSTNVAIKLCTLFFNSAYFTAKVYICNFHLTNFCHLSPLTGTITVYARKFKALFPSFAKRTNKKQEKKPTKKK